MKSEINIGELLNEIKNSSFLLNCKLPIGYTCGLPILQIKNGNLCLTIPYLKFKTTGVPDKTLVFPIRYAIKVSLPDKTIVGFEDFKFNSAFENVDFENAIGLFRHDAIKQYNKHEYKQKRNELISMYDKIASAIIYDTDYSEDEDDEFRNLLNIMIEPSLKPIYKALDSDFYNKYLA